MKPKAFIKELDEEKVVAAIAGAERRTSGEIRIFVSHKPVVDALAEAQQQFVKLGMTKTKLRNAVLIYFAPRSRSFAIVGDAGVHQQCGDRFWQEVSGLMSERLKQGHPTDAVTAAVAKVGELLAEHFPREPGDENELPDAVIEE